MAMTELLCPGCFEKKDRPQCASCGYDESKAQSPIALPHRTLLQEQFLVGRVLGNPGGFGITYLGWDISLETRVAIKEFFPAAIVSRDFDNKTVVPHSTESGEVYHRTLKQFIHEARSLAKFDHPNVVRVRHYFEAFNTAYLVMDYYEGLSVAEKLRIEGGQMSEKEAIDIMMQVLDGLKHVHAKSYLHRDIKPHNIYLTTNGRAILLDFGAARQSLGEYSRTLTVIWTPGFAPPEQKDEHGNQGPWTDVYGCAATLYFMVTGETPPDATDPSQKRLFDSPNQNAETLSVDLIKALKKSLVADPKHRPQTVDEFENFLARVRLEPASERSRRTARWIWGVPAAVLIIIALLVIWFVADKNVTASSLEEALRKPLKTTVLNLRKNDLEELPPELGQLANLRELDLSGNKLSELSPQIFRLTRLQKLDLSHNNLSALPRSIGNLASLQTLHLRWNRLRQLPTELSLLAGLMELDISNNEIVDLGDEIGKLSRLENLRALKLSGCNLSHLPREIAHLAKLEALDLSDNVLTRIPSEIGLLTNLQSLKLELNQLSEVTAELENLFNLEVLDLYNNQLETIALDLTKLENLKTLDLRENKISQAELASVKAKLPGTDVKF